MTHVLPADATADGPGMNAIPAPGQAAVAAALSVFGAAVKPKLAGPGQPEDQMRGPLETLLVSVAKDLGLTLNPVGETSLSDLKLRADYAIEVDGALVGYVEVKAPGKGADPTVWAAKSHDRQQWEKLKNLPNVLYTDGNAWGLYRKGQTIGQVARARATSRPAAQRSPPTAPGSRASSTRSCDGNRSPPARSRSW